MADSGAKAPKDREPELDLGSSMTRAQIAALTPEQKKKRLALRRAARGTPRAYYEKLVRRHSTQLKFMQQKFPDMSDEHAPQQLWEIFYEIEEIITKIDLLASDVAALPEDWKPIPRTPPKKLGVATLMKKIEAGRKVVIVDKKKTHYMMTKDWNRTAASRVFVVLKVDDRTVLLEAPDGEGKREQAVVLRAHLRRVQEEKTEEG